MRVWIGFNDLRIVAYLQVGISGAAAKSHQLKFVPLSHPGLFRVVVSLRKSQTKVDTLACFDFL